MSYAQPSDFLARYDARRVGDLVQDLGTRVSPAQLLADPNLQAALNDAAGTIDAALLRGGRYKATDLQGLLPPATATNSYYLLLRLNVDLAYGLLLARRDLVAPDRVKESQAAVAALAEGSMIFGDISAAVVAGQPVNVQLDSNILLISSIDRIFGSLQVGNDPTNNFRT